ncbi:archaellin/type IV pilin N-terminal domain-containing protein [Chloroflexota bacterium]
MFRRPFKKAVRNQKGITGLETAIILIAFVVVAAVFAYTALSAGLFSTQKSKEAIHSGLKEARGCLVVRGCIVAEANPIGESGTVTQITLTVVNAMNGEPIDFAPLNDADNNRIADSGSNNKVVISYFDKDNNINDLYWSLTKPGDCDSDNLLEANEQFIITIGQSSTTGNLVTALDTDLSVDTSFVIEVNPAQGAVVTIERKTPAYMESVMNLY